MFTGRFFMPIQALFIALSSLLCESKKAALRLQKRQNVTGKPCQNRAVGVC